MITITLTVITITILITFGQLSGLFVNIFCFTFLRE